MQNRRLRGYRCRDQANKSFVRINPLGPARIFPNLLDVTGPALVSEDPISDYPAHYECTNLYTLRYKQVRTHTTPRTCASAPPCQGKGKRRLTRLLTKGLSLAHAERSPVEISPAQTAEGPGSCDPCGYGLRLATATRLRAGKAWRHSLVVKHCSRLTPHASGCLFLASAAFRGGSEIIAPGPGVFSPCRQTGRGSSAQYTYPTNLSHCRGVNSRLKPRKHVSRTVEAERPRIASHRIVARLPVRPSFDTSRHRHKVLALCSLSAIGGPRDCADHAATHARCGKCAPPSPRRLFSAAKGLSRPQPPRSGALARTLHAAMGRCQPPCLPHNGATGCNPSTQEMKSVPSWCGSGTLG